MFEIYKKGEVPDSIANLSPEMVAKQIQPRLAEKGIVLITIAVKNPTQFQYLIPVEYLGEGIVSPKDIELCANDRSLGKKINLLIVTNVKGSITYIHRGGTEYYADLHQAFYDVFGPPQVSEVSK